MHAQIREGPLAHVTPLYADGYRLPRGHRPSSYGRLQLIYTPIGAGIRHPYPITALYLLDPRELQYNRNVIPLLYDPVLASVSEKGCLVQGCVTTGPALELGPLHLFQSWWVVPQGEGSARRLAEMLAAP